MSEEYEVPGPHEHQIEHQAEHGHALSQQIAIFTAILASVGAFVSYLGGHTQNEALYYKNDAVLNRALASDQWAYFQAKAIKEQLAQGAVDAAANPARATALTEKVKHYAEEKEAIKKKAEEFEALSERANEKSEHALHPHEKLAMAMTLIQIAISAASITALTRRRWLFVIAAASAIAGIATGIFAFLS